MLASPSSSSTLTTVPTPNLSCRTRAPGTTPPEVVADEIAQWDEADYVVVTAGRFDVLVEVVCVDRHGLLDVTNRIRQLPEVVSTESFLYLELWKQLYDWGVGVDGRQNGASA